MLNAATLNIQNCMREGQFPERNDQITAVDCLIDVKAMKITRWEVGECPLDRDRLKAGLTVDQESLHGGLYGGS